MTDLEAKAIVALRSVKMPEKSWHGRCAEFLYGKLSLAPYDRLTNRQQGDLWLLVWRYRRQIEDREVVAHAEELVNGAMSLAF